MGTVSHYSPAEWDYIYERALAGWTSTRIAKGCTRAHGTARKPSTISGSAVWRKARSRRAQMIAAGKTPPKVGGSKAAAAPAPAPVVVAKLAPSLGIIPMVWTLRADGSPLDARVSLPMVSILARAA